MRVIKRFAILCAVLFRFHRRDLTRKRSYKWRFTSWTLNITVSIDWNIASRFCSTDWKLFFNFRKPNNHFLPPSRHLYFIPSKGLGRLRYYLIWIWHPQNVFFWPAVSHLGEKQKILQLCNLFVSFPFIFTLKKSGAMAEKTPHFNAILSRVRGKLRSENVKLWLPPYTSSNDQPGYYPEVTYTSVNLKLIDSKRRSIYFISHSHAFPCANWRYILSSKL